MERSSIRLLLRVLQRAEATRDRRQAGPVFGPARRSSSITSVIAFNLARYCCNLTPRRNRSFGSICTDDDQV